MHFDNPFNPVVLYGNDLIFISMNINDNLKMEKNHWKLVPQGLIRTTFHPLGQFLMDAKLLNGIT